MPSLTDDVARYYDARAPVYDQTAGYASPESERSREPIKARYQEFFRGRTVLEIACGSGYWTAVIGATAERVLAMDVNPSMIEIGRERCGHVPNVTFQVADAYTLDGVPSGFTAAFAHWWWSHVPRERLRGFLAALHSKLEPGAQVLFVDQLPYDGAVRRQDAAGNTLERRNLPDGRSFEIVKNFPSEQEVHEALAAYAQDVRYVKHEEEGSWSVTYRAKP